MRNDDAAIAQARADEADAYRRSVENMNSHRSDSATPAAKPAEPVFRRDQDMLDGPEGTEERAYQNSVHNINARKA